MITAIWGFLTAYIFTSVFFSFLSVVLFIMVIVGWWRIFTKAGKSGWTSIIPIYNMHVLYKISWSPCWFWISVLLQAAAQMLEYWLPDNRYAVWGAGIMAFAAGVIAFIQNIKLSRAYGHGIPFGLGLFFFPSVFVLILGCGSSRYVGARR